MANFAKYTAYTVAKLLDHNNRLPDENRERANEDIDYERTMLNYHFKKGDVSDVKKRLSEVLVLKVDRSVVIGEMIVTLPKNVKSEDEKSFFEAVYDFYCEDLGKENIINAVVHKDEVTPHIHIDFVPVIKGEVNFDARGSKMVEEYKRIHGTNEVERLCCKELINRKYLNLMHQRLSAYVTERLGYETEILNGATANGNKTVSRLKLDSLHSEIETLKKQADGLKTEISQIHKIAKDWGINEYDIGLKPLIELVDDLEKQNHILREIIERKGYTYSSEELRIISKKKFKPSTTAKVSVLDGSLTQADIENNAVVVIEIPTKEAPKEKESEDNDKEPSGEPHGIPEMRRRRGFGMMSEIPEGMSPEEYAHFEQMRRASMRDERFSPGGRMGARSNITTEPSPQQAFLDKEREAGRYARSAAQIQKDVYIKESRMTDRKYVYIKTYEGNEEKLISSILELERQLREMDDLKDKKIYIDRLSGDRLDIARSALATLDAQTFYFTRREMEEKEESKTIVRE